jgi:hypothetical protein
MVDDEGVERFDLPSRSWVSFYIHAFVGELHCTLL